MAGCPDQDSEPKPGHSAGFLVDRARRIKQPSPPGLRSANRYHLTASRRSLCLHHGPAPLVSVQRDTGRVRIRCDIPRRRGHPGPHPSAVPSPVRRQRRSSPPGRKRGGQGRPPETVERREKGSGVFSRQGSTGRKVEADRPRAPTTRDQAGVPTARQGGIANSATTDYAVGSCHAPIVAGAAAAGARAVEPRNQLAGESSPANPRGAWIQGNRATSAPSGVDTPAAMLWRGIGRTGRLERGLPPEGGNHFRTRGTLAEPPQKPGQVDQINGGGPDRHSLTPSIGREHDGRNPGSRGSAPARLATRPSPYPPAGLEHGGHCGMP